MLIDGIGQGLAYLLDHDIGKDLPGHSDGKKIVVKGVETQLLYPRGVEFGGERLLQLLQEGVPLWVHHGAEVG